MAPPPRPSHQPRLVRPFGSLLSLVFLSSLLDFSSLLVFFFAYFLVFLVFRLSGCIQSASRWSLRKSTTTGVPRLDVREPHPPCWAQVEVLLWLPPFVLLLSRLPGRGLVRAQGTMRDREDSAQELGAGQAKAQGEEIPWHEEIKRIVKPTSLSLFLPGSKNENIRRYAPA